MPVASPCSRARRSPTAPCRRGQHGHAEEAESGLMPRRNEAAPPALLTSASAWPAKDWPRITVNTPTTPETTAAPPPMTAAVCTGSLVKKPGAKKR